MESEPVRQFKGVWIPREIWEHPHLTWLEKCLLAEIDSLSKHDRPCTASNMWLGKRFQVSENRMHNLIGSLRKRGFIEDAGFDGRIRSIRVLGLGSLCLPGNRSLCLPGNRSHGLPGNRSHLHPLSGQSETPPVRTTEYSEKTDQIGNGSGGVWFDPDEDQEAGKSRRWPIVKRWLDNWNANGAGYSESQVRRAWLSCEAYGWKTMAGNPIVDPRAAVESRIYGTSKKLARKGPNI